jgi:membrane-bound serine protease (ClpP class)
LILGLVLLLAGLAAACGSSEQDPGKVHVLTWDGVVNPVMARYIDRGIDNAEASQAVAVVIQLDTPGGLMDSMRDVIQRIDSSTVPVIVWVAPSGGRAASAGTFITMAGHVAAMAPNTTIGAATPVSGSGEDIEGALGRKVTNDAVAYIRSIAELRDRNADWAESAVRDAAAVSENDAVELDVVDFVATNLDDLLAQSNGREVEVISAIGGVPAPVTINTEGAPIYENDTNLFEEMLDLLANPDIAFLLLTLGGLALVIEILTPGFGIGVFGVIALILAYFSLGTLPTNETGVVLIALGLILIAAEVFVSGFGILGIGGGVALVAGGLILFSDSPPGVDDEVSRWLVFGVAAIAVAVIGLFVTALIKERRRPVSSGREKLMGATGRANTRLDPTGYVTVQGERWEATSDDGPIEAGMPVVVTHIDGIRLRVRGETQALPPAPPTPVLPPGESRPERS